MMALTEKMSCFSVPVCMRSCTASRVSVYSRTCSNKSYTYFFREQVLPTQKCVHSAREFKAISTATG